MHFLSFLTLAASVSAVALPEPASNTVKTCKANSKEVVVAAAAFKIAKIVPDKVKNYDDRINLIPSFSPNTVVDVTYKPVTGDKKVKYGTVVKTSETLIEPVVYFYSEPDSKYKGYNYTVIMADPDAPIPGTATGTKPILKSFLHWIYYDAKACDSSENRDKTKDRPMYMAPTPLSKQRHRYIFLVYRQPKGTYMPPSDPIKYRQTLPGVLAADRGMFDINEYVKDAKLEGPVAGNFFLQGTLDV